MESDESTPPPPYIYDTLKKMTVMVEVTPTDKGTFDAKIVADADTEKRNILGAIATYMALPDKTTFPGIPIIMGGSSKCGKSRRKRKSKKARKGKSLRRK